VPRCECGEKRRLGSKWAREAEREVLILVVELEDALLRHATRLPAHQIRGIARLANEGAELGEAWHQVSHERMPDVVTLRRRTTKWHGVALDILRSFAGLDAVAY
jgi:hypothetical protein